ncbi:MAG TPA: hypothetical protein VF173_10350 [Thermoanaerobaculia bacterium]|nr:hypothetical protein [Thermoanaerobaculia bacterium]
MSDHETPEELEGDLERRLSSKASMRHLLRGCSTCQAAAWESLLFLKRAARGEPAAEGAITDYSDATFDRAASNALLALSLPPREQRRFLAATSALRSGDGVLAITQSAEMSVQGLGIYEALLARSWALRYESPTEMCHLARVAMEVAGGLDPAAYGAARVADLRARAWGELANAYRVADRLREAGSAFGEAFAFARQGSSDRALKMRLLDLEASYLGTLREFPLALERLTMLAKLYQEGGDDHLAGRALIKKALYTYYRGDTEEACRTIEEGLFLIDLGRDPTLGVTGTLNQLLFQVECGRFTEAKKLLFRNRVQFQSLDRILKLRLRGIEGRIGYGRGELESAEIAFRETKEGFAGAGMSFACGIAGLDLALTLLRLGRRDEAIAEGLESAALFFSVGVHREIYGTAALLEDCFRKERTDLALLEASVQYLRKKMIELGVG